MFFASKFAPTYTETAGIKELINGPESFTPDGNFILGESPELKNFYVGAGFNAYGIAAGGGAGMALAEWIANGQPPYDLWPVDIRRFGKPHQDLEWVRKRTYEAYAKHYTMAWPFEEHSSGRPFQQSPIYENLKNADNNCLPVIKLNFFQNLKNNNKCLPVIMIKFWNIFYQSSL